MRHLLALASGFAFVATSTATAGAQSAAAPSRTPSMRVTLGVGVAYIHQPAFTFTRGTITPRSIDEPATDGAGIALGGGLEVIGARWWGGVGAQALLTMFDQGSSVIATAHAGRVVPRVLGGTLRVGLGPVLARSERRERTIRPCSNDCASVHPPALVTGGLGVALVQEWRPLADIGFALEGQAASGAQRFVMGRVRVTLGP